MLIFCSLCTIEVDLLEGFRSQPSTDIHIHEEFSFHGLAV